MKWAHRRVQCYGRHDEMVVVDDFRYPLSPVTHPNGCNASNFPPLVCSASLLSLSRCLQWLFLSSFFAALVLSQSLSPPLLQTLCISVSLSLSLSARNAPRDYCLSLPLCLLLLWRECGRTSFSLSLSLLSFARFPFLSNSLLPFSFQRN